MMKKARSLVRMPACISLVWIFLIWSSCSILNCDRSWRTLVGRLVAVGELLALVGRRDDAGLQLLAALVERLDAAGHRVRDRRRSVDRGHDCERGDAAEDRRDQDDVEAEKRGASGRHVSCPPQISKLTILAMMKPPMLIQTRPPSAGDDQTLVREEPAHVIGFIK